ncbi:MAG: DUF502 domain-containing protein [Verrucomicrobia bacterium]|nr:DUF502 domain-containing protein [Verrucomicrobiota bacterium]
MKHDTPWHRFKGNFLTGLAVVFPAVISIAIILWLFGTVSNMTDMLLVFLPKQWTHQTGAGGPGTGPMHWYWSLFALVLAVALISLMGRYARHYVGRKAIEFVDWALMQTPLVNKVYGTIKQVNQAFTSSSKSSFKQVVLLEFPRKGMYSMGFVTSEQNQEIQMKTKDRVLSVFVPTTPNPTTGYLLFVPEGLMTKLDMSVPDGIKCVVSLGSISPEYTPLVDPTLVAPTMASGDIVGSD